MQTQITAEAIEKRIFWMRGLKVMVDRDIAVLYGVKTFALNQAVKRNLERFPEGFMLRLNRREMRELITNCDRFSSLKHSNVPPLAFTEYGIAMLSSVLRSRRAIRINVEIVQAFIRLRRMATAHGELGRRIDEMERRYDGQFKVVFDAIRGLMREAEKPRRRIGFVP